VTLAFDLEHDPIVTETPSRHACFRLSARVRLDRFTSESPRGRAPRERIKRGGANWTNQRRHASVRRPVWHPANWDSVCRPSITG